MLTMTMGPGRRRLASNRDPGRANAGVGLTAVSDPFAGLPALAFPSPTVVSSGAMAGSLPIHMELSAGPAG
jgi:hypothetical protein